METTQKHTQEQVALLAKRSIEPVPPPLLKKLPREPRVIILRLSTWLPQSTGLRVQAQTW